MFKTINPKDLSCFYPSVFFRGRKRCDRLGPGSGLRHVSSSTCPARGVFASKATSLPSAVSMRVS